MIRMYIFSKIYKKYVGLGGEAPENFCIFLLFFMIYTRIFNLLSRFNYETNLEFGAWWGNCSPALNGATA